MAGRLAVERGADLAPDMRWVVRPLDFLELSGASLLK